jgi:hypothetical protein
MRPAPIPRRSGVARVAAAAVALLALGACADARRAVGWDKAPPDEFRVTTRAPLSLPPDFGLRPPQPGAPRPQEGTAIDQARNAVSGGRSAPRNQSAIQAASAGQAALLTRTGADRADPSIRETVDREALITADAERSFTDKLVFWRDSDPPGTVVDPNAESQRLRENQALGRPSTEGQTPVIRRRERGILEGIF